MSGRDILNRKQNCFLDVAVEPIKPNESSGDRDRSVFMFCARQHQWVVKTVITRESFTNRLEKYIDQTCAGNTPFTRHGQDAKCSALRPGQHALNSESGARNLLISIN